MAKTIKLQVLSKISEHRGGVTRRQIQEFIWDAQGMEGPFVYRQGYYGTNIRSWTGELIKQVDGRGSKYKVTALGRKYIADPKAYRVITMRKTIKEQNQRIDRMWDELRAFYRKEYRNNNGDAVLKQSIQEQIELLSRMANQI